MGQSSARPWLLGIATNVIREHLKRTGRPERRYLIEAPSGDPSEELDERIDAKSLAPLLDQALASLDPRDRDTLLLFALSDLTYREIAAAMNVPIGTVRSRLARARMRVRAALDPTRGPCSRVEKPET